MSQQTFLHSTVGDYQLVDFLGAGGMGEVYRGVHSKIGRVVAIKILNPAAGDPTTVERFLNEARIQSRLQHPNIATLYDFLEVGGKPCIVMEYVGGEMLSERIAACAALSWQESLAIFQPILQAVGYMHENGIVHRDIKSSNIKITPRGEVKLLDFGIARSEHTPRFTIAGSVIGTLQYLAPELIRGGEADSRTDVWALGVLLYEMVTGQMPFEGSSLPDLFKKIQSAAFAAPSMWAQSFPAELERIISKCLKRRPDDRYATAKEILDDVRAASETAADGAAKVSGRSTQENLLVTLPWRWIAIGAGLVVIFVIVLSVIWIPEPVPNSNTPGTPNAGATAVSSLPAATSAAGEMHPVLIDVAEGKAAVFRDGREIGKTPYEFKARLGDHVDVVLKADGFNDLRVTFDVGENRNKYVYPLEKIPQGGK